MPRLTLRTRSTPLLAFPLMAAGLALPLMPAQGQGTQVTPSDPQRPSTSKPSSSQTRSSSPAPIPGRPPTPTPDETLAYNATIQQASVKMGAGQHQEAYKLLSGVLGSIRAFGDQGSLLLYAYAARKSGQLDQALAAFKEVAEALDDDEYWTPYVETLIEARRWNEAEQSQARIRAAAEQRRLLRRIRLERGLALYQSKDYAGAVLQLGDPVLSGQSDAQILLGWSHYQTGSHPAAVQAFSRAYSLDPSSQAAEGLVYSAQAAGQFKVIAEVLRVAPKGPLADRVSNEAKAALAQPSPPVGRLAVTAEGRLILVPAPPAAAAKPSAAATTATPPEWRASLAPSLRDKKGSPGTSSLRTDGQQLRLQRLTPGSEWGVEVSHQQHDNAIQEASTRALVLSTSQRGESGEWSAQAGIRSSSARDQASPTGELSWQQYPSAAWPLGLSLGVYRQPVEESLLSIAGASLPSPLGGRQLGGPVLETGAKAGLNWQIDSWEAIASVGLAHLGGDGVADNSKADLYLRALRPLGLSRQLRVGPELYVSGFSENLSAFTPGHGGYFSPRLFVKSGLVADYLVEQTSRRVRLTGSLGYAFSESASADGLPLEGGLPGFVAASRSSGLAYSLEASLRSQLVGNWWGELQAGTQQSPDYDDWRVQIRLEHRWRP